VVVCSELTAALTRARTEQTVQRTTAPEVELFPAGHVAGSRAALISDPDGTHYLYTGDICTRSRLYLDGFQPPNADVLITEATYGEPGYVFPEHSTLREQIIEWLRETPEPVLLFGYALGRAQKLELLASMADRDVYTTDAVLRVNTAIEEYREVEFDVAEYTDEVSLESGDALVLPMTTSRYDWIDSLAAETGAQKAGFSGWAVDESFKYRGDFDVTFPLSDHCDFEELCEMVNTVDPMTVYTQHGSVETLAKELEERGYSATALERNQFSLDDFS